MEDEWMYVPFARVENGIQWHGVDGIFTSDLRASRCGRRSS